MSTAVFGAPEWRARSGRVIKPLTDGTITFQGSHGYLAPRTAMDAEEYFQAKRDEDLGRWRWPENPEYVVYPLKPGGGCTALSERTGVSKTWVERSDAAGDGSYLAPAARAYFEAHPERKPWHSAEAGEVWILSIDDSEDIPCVVTSSGPDFEPISHPVWATFARGSDRITSGHRIWPVDEMAPAELHASSSQAGLASIRGGL